MSHKLFSCFCIGLAVLLSSSCATPRTPPLAPSATPIPPTATATLVPPTPIPPTPTPTPLREISGHPLAWFAPLPPLPIHAGRPFTGSDDFMSLFAPDASWQRAAGHIQVFKLYGEWVAYQASDAQLKQVVDDLNRRGIALAVEAGPLDAPSDCGSGIEGFAGSAEGLKIARRIQNAGGYLRFVAMDEPFAFASLYDGANACQWTPEKVAQEVARYVALMKGIFPQVLVGDTEPLWSGIDPQRFREWMDAYKTVTGTELPFFHLDVDFSRPDWVDAALEIEGYARERGIPFGVIYAGSPIAASDQNWLAQAGERAKAFEAASGGPPDHVLFQSWNDHPDRVLPETGADTFTSFIDVYFEQPEMLGARTQGEGANLAYGKPARASRSLSGFEPAKALDENPDTWWGAGDFAPQWIEIDLGAAYAVAEIRLQASQSPYGRTVHRLKVKGADANDAFALAQIFDGVTTDGDWLVYTNPQPGTPIRYARIETVSSPSWVAWREIQVIAAGEG